MAALYGLKAWKEWLSFARTKRGKATVAAWNEWRKTEWGVYLCAELPGKVLASASGAYELVAPYVEGIAEVFA